MAEPDPRVKSDSDKPIPFLVGSIDDINRHVSFCPYAATLTGYSMVLGCVILSQIKCKRWGCRHCGPRRINSLALRVRNAKANRFITLTVNTGHYDSPRAAYDDTRRKLSTLSRRIRTRFGSFEYVRILEVTKKGWPHYHLICRSGYIPQKWISEAWSTLTGAYIVDVRKIDNRENVYFYIVKYLSKCKYIPWTNRRVSWTRKFFPEKSKPTGFPLGLEEKTYESEHPAEVLQKLWHAQPVVSFNLDVLILESSLQSATRSREDWLLQTAENAIAKPAAIHQEKGCSEGKGTDADDGSPRGYMAGITRDKSNTARERLFRDRYDGHYQT